MAYVITQRCCNDASCVAECPVECIRPRPGDSGFASAELLHIDPDTCIDCGACVEACPVAATIFIPPNAGKALDLLVHATQTGTIPPDQTFTTAVSYPTIDVLAKSQAEKAKGLSAGRA